jgi:hypothetical protein
MQRERESEKTKTRVSKKHLPKKQIQKKLKICHLNEIGGAGDEKINPKLRSLQKCGCAVCEQHGVKDDKQMVAVPKHLKVPPPNSLYCRRVHYHQHQQSHVPRRSLRIRREEKKKKKKKKTQKKKKKKKK